VVALSDDRKEIAGLEPLLEARSAGSRPVTKHTPADWNDPVDLYGNSESAREYPIHWVWKHHP